jgi:hypothetical protein
MYTLPENASLSSFEFVSPPSSDALAPTLFLIVLKKLGTDFDTLPQLVHLMVHHKHDVIAK